MKFKTCLLPVVFALAGTIGSSCSAEVIKIAQIDPFSGPAAGLNQNNVHMLEFEIDLANRNGWAGPGNTFELVQFDDKNSPQEALLQLKNATDQGIRYVTQGLSSAVGLALIDGVNRYNERHPGKEVIFLSPTDGAPEMTNENCSFWHFRFDSNNDMKVKALMSFMAKDKSLKKVYLINQNYAMGQQTSVAAKRDLERLRPDIKIVGDDLIPLLQVKDFSPYVDKIKASGADAIITANWGPDLILLAKAAKDASLKIPFYTFYAATTGIPTALAAAGVENVKTVTFWVSNDNLDVSKTLVEPFKAKYHDDFTNLPWYNMMRMFAQAIKDAKSSEPVAVAHALEGMKMQALNGEIEMRKSDHQLQQPLVVANWEKTNGKDVRYDLENTGYGFKTIEKISAAAVSLPTSCKMKRPG